MTMDLFTMKDVIDTFDSRSQGMATRHNLRLCTRGTFRLPHILLEGYYGLLEFGGFLVYYRDLAKAWIERHAVMILEDTQRQSLRPDRMKYLASQMNIFYRIFQFFACLSLDRKLSIEDLGSKSRVLTFKIARWVKVSTTKKMSEVRLD